MLQGFGKIGNLLGIALCALALLTTVGCRPLTRERTLPPSIRNVHVPMAFNRTAEPGLEERVTVEVQKEILADGRLNITPQRNADAIIFITINNLETFPAITDRDDFPVIQQYRVTTSVDVRENIPGLPPIGKPRRVITEYIFNADTRTTTFDPEPRYRDAFASVHAKDILLQLITGEIIDPDTEEDLGGTEQRSTLNLGL